MTVITVITVTHVDARIVRIANVVRRTLRGKVMAMVMVIINSKQIENLFCNYHGYSLGSWLNRLTVIEDHLDKVTGTFKRVGT